MRHCKIRAAALLLALLMALTAPVSAAETASAVRLPILGMGGVSRAEDAAQLMLAGASAVAVGTALFADPYAPLKVRDGLAELAAKQGLSAVRELTGGVQPW